MCPRLYVPVDIFCITPRFVTGGVECIDMNMFYVLCYKPRSYTECTLFSYKKHEAEIRQKLRNM